MTFKQQLKIVRDAKKRIETDIHVANSMIRDLPITKETGNSNLVWAMHHAGVLCKNDLLPTLNELEGALVKKIEERVKKQSELEDDALGGVVALLLMVWGIGYIILGGGL